MLDRQEWRITLGPIWKSRSAHLDEAERADKHTYKAADLHAA
jgi:hypothetical protein